MQFLKDTFIKYEIHTLFYTCDNSFLYNKVNGNLNGTLMTANFFGNITENLNGLKKLQPNKPRHVSEFYSGWYSRWKGKHEVRPSNVYQKYLETILFQFNASVNLYVFLGGSNFGFMSSEGVETSYDFDAPLTEDGQYGDKYYKTKQTIGMIFTKLLLKIK